MDASFGKVAAQQALRANPSYAAGRGAVTPLDFTPQNRYNMFSKESLQPVCIWDKPQGISCMGVLSVIEITSRPPMVRPLMADWKGQEEQEDGTDQR